MAVLWKKFNALGTEIVISADLSTEQSLLLDQAEIAIKNFEKNFSRFLVDSELSKFNKTIDQEIIVSDAMLELLAASKFWFDFSKGIFDPTVLSNLERLGYDKSFTELNSEVSPETELDLEKIKQAFNARARLDQLTVVDHKVTKPSTLRLDFGGLGKGYIVDKVSQGIFSGIANYWLSAGGDLLVSGKQEGQLGWKIGVQNPYEPKQEIFSLNSRGEKLGVATSGVWQRQGIKAGVNWHHLIDPRTGLPAANEILAVTALASSATKADILAKMVLILGELKGLEFIEKENGAAALIFLKNGAIVFSSQAKNYL